MAMGIGAAWELHPEFSARTFVEYKSSFYRALREIENARNLAVS